MIWDVAKAQQRFNLAHSPLGRSQLKLQRFLEEQLEAKGAVRCYGTTTNPSQQLKNKLGQAGTIPGGLLTLSVESRAIHDRAVKTLVDDWAGNAGWPKLVACVALAHPTDAGWRIGTIVEWKHSRFPETVRKRLFPDIVVLPARGSPAADKDGAGAVLYCAQVQRVGAQLVVTQSTVVSDDAARLRYVADGDATALLVAVHDALGGRL